ncbi:hypothetical protein PR048_032139 [Dryococelus australis]|uniref:MICOS complex subunit MIC13 n=1 Tax=Dryococelus australis TaxID=614101 RepID=A0ABQ9G5I6_9NEOP|nr:hypothetical protein PR048_032139 [Dryococelus australis]
MSGQERHEKIPHSQLGREPIIVSLGCRFGVKVGIASAAIYYTAREGLWDDAGRSEQLYKKIYTNVLPYMEEVPVPIEVRLFYNLTL